MRHGKGVTYVSGSSQTGRRMQSAKGTGDLVGVHESKDPAIREHNARIEAERQAKLAARKARRGG